MLCYTYVTRAKLVSNPLNNMSAFYRLPVNHNVRNFNKHAAVGLIRFTGKGLPRTDLAEEMGLTRAAVNIIVSDLPTREILKRSGTSIGIAVAGLINLFNPGTVITGGGVSQARDLLTVPIRQAVRDRSLRASEHGVKITTAMLGRLSSLIGALVQAINIAIHETIEHKSPGARNHALAIEQESEFNVMKEVIVNKD